MTNLSDGIFKSLISVPEHDVFVCHVYYGQINRRTETHHAFPTYLKDLMLVEPFFKTSNLSLQLSIK